MSDFTKFFEDKLNNFTNLIKSKNNEDMTKNVEGLIFIYKLGGMKLFIENMVLPLEEKLKDRNSEVLSLLYPPERISEILELFNEDEKERVYKFIDLLIDSRKLF